MLKIIPSLLKHRSIQIFVVITLYLLTASSLPMEVHQFFYSVSLFIKDLLLWLLPISVGLFIAHAITSFEKRAPLFILTLLLFEAFSNSMCVWYSYACGHIASGSIQAFETSQIVEMFSPLWRAPIARPSWWSAEKGIYAGIALGLFAVFKSPSLRRILTKGKEGAEFVLTRFFSKMIPLFILGFVARMYKTDLLTQMFTLYADFLVWLSLFLIAYILFLFLVGSGFSFPIFLRSIKNLLPATGMAFSSGCSLSTMPWTIEGASKNLKNPELAKALIPATTNIQQVGDCIINAFLCFLIYFHFNGHPPALSVWIPFSIVFVLARFATAAVLGGAIFVMLPIYEHYLGFTPEMAAIILAFNVILDPIVTCTNVIGNGALCRIFERAWTVVSKRRVAE